MKKLIFGLIAIVMFSILGNAQNLRTEFLKGKTHKEAVVAYNKLSEGEQKKLWLEKIEQLLSLSLPNEHKNYISKIKNSIEQGVNRDQSKEFLQNIVNLAKITPMKDFGMMFETLEDYKFYGKFIDTKAVPETIIIDLANLNLFTDASTSSVARGDCSCRWCLFHDGQTGTNCNRTSYGCGFLWMQSCNQCVLCL
ncbi:hypothetical protein Q361_1613 [Flavobacterium croceum DSM 17960]|uniref:Uncharacterized protein n=1 Tax=Flavobacterium croceum DSM 17960 TaxID=1121886 RepID=A0A2S4N4A5_9FLAO|nr:bacteriocin fulvocin C-related protein [Flavobacterium croceum]POS00558.1 hypothetical protein Q361_1613 [Flavobacterium croceum DSM 17960]